MGLLAEIPYPRIDPILIEISDAIKVRWYGLSYVMAFVAAYLVLYGLAKRKRWPVAAERVADVLFWGILGVFVGGRLGYEVFYKIPMGTFEWGRVWKVWEGGMSFHGGLLGVVVAYWIYSIRMKVPRGELFDGLTLAAPLGIFFVRVANFINAELYGRIWDGSWAMRFPDYERACTIVDGQTHCGPEHWVDSTYAARPESWLPDLRHPSQLYEAFFEGLLLFFVLRWLMLRKGWGGGMISGLFLVLYGAARFGIEFTREPDKGLDFPWFGTLTQGQALCIVMVVLGAIVLWRSRGGRAAPAPVPEGAETPAG